MTRRSTRSSKRKQRSVESESENDLPESQKKQKVSEVVESDKEERKEEDPAHDDDVVLAPENHTCDETGSKEEDVDTESKNSDQRTGIVSDEEKDLLQMSIATPPATQSDGLTQTEQQEVDEVANSQPQEVAPIGVGTDPEPLEVSNTNNEENEDEDFLGDIIKPGTEPQNHSSVESGSEGVQQENNRAESSSDNNDITDRPEPEDKPEHEQDDERETSNGLKEENGDEEVPSPEDDVSPGGDEDASAPGDHTGPDEGEEEGDEEGEEMWDLVHVISHKQLTNANGAIICSTEDCGLIAACVYRCQQNATEKWYSCLDCQESDFGGWPSLDEMPIKTMDEEHKRVMIKKCSRKRKPNMPSFEATSPSPTPLAVEEGSARDPNPLTPPPPPPRAPQQSSNCEEKKSANQVTPTPKKPAPVKLSASALAMHRKWQEAAVSMGGPGALIVVDKPVGKKLIFDMLHDAFCPMNITMIYKELKAAIPSPVLKSFLDDMVGEKYTSKNPFDEGDSDSEDEGRQSQGGNKKADDAASKRTDSDPYKRSLLLKIGRNANTSLYYPDHTKLKNDGNGLTIDERNELYANVNKAEEEESTLGTTLDEIEKTANRLFGEPTNEELNAQLAEMEDSVGQLRDEAAEKRKLKANEQHKKQLKKRVDTMAAQWRKRKRMTLEFMITLEENTDGAVSSKKCFAGDGQIYMESDERVVEDSKSFAKNKKARNKNGRIKTVTRKSSSSPQRLSGLAADEGFIAVLLDRRGAVVRQYVDE